MMLTKLMAFLLLALAIPTGAVQFRASSKQPSSSYADFSNEDSTPCVLNELGHPAEPCHIEHSSRSMVREWLPSDATVLEVGARYGSVSCTIATKQHQSGKLVSVESDFLVWNALDGNLKTYGCNVNVLKGVVGTTPVSIQHLGNGGYGTRTVPDSESAADTKKVAAFTLAAVEKSYKMRFDTLVVDCEGCFPTLLRENPDLLKNIQMLIIEAHTDRPEDSEEQSVKDLQAKFGFEVVAQVNRQFVLKRVKAPDASAGSEFLADEALIESDLKGMRG